MSPYKMLTVLVVDDDITIRTYMQRSLEATGVGCVITAATWQEVQSILSQALIHGAFLDLVLQRGSGLDIGRDLATKGIPVVFCSGVDDEFNSGQMLEIGWVLPKPVRLAGLKRALDTFLCRQRACMRDCDVREMR